VSLDFGTDNEELLADEGVRLATARRACAARNTSRSSTSSSRRQR
jgi:hypothetical protein